MKKLLLFWLDFAFYLFLYSLSLAIFEKVLIWRMDFFAISLFIGIAFLFYLPVVYVFFRINREGRIAGTIRKLPIPLYVVRHFLIPGFRFPFSCVNPGCGGAIVRTMIYESHSLAGKNQNVYFPFSSNRCKINLGLLARFRQAFGGDKLFCIECGTEYVNPVYPAENSSNLYEILNKILPAFVREP